MRREIGDDRERERVLFPSCLPQSASLGTHIYRHGYSMPTCPSIIPSRFVPFLLLPGE